MYATASCGILLVNIQNAFSTAVQYVQQGRLHEAEAICHQILAIWPEQAGVLHLLGVIAYMAGRHVPAVRLIERAIGADPLQLNFHADLALVLQAQGRFKESAEICHATLRLQPNYAEVYHHLGNAMKAQGQLDQAIVAYRKAIELNPNSAVVFNNLGIALGANGDLNSAVLCYIEAIKLSPDLAAAHHNLGLAKYHQGLITEAIGAYKSAVRLQSNYADAYINLGVALVEDGQLEAAIESFNVARTLDPNRAELYRNWGVAAHQMGRIEEAIEHFRRAVRLRPSDASNHSALVYGGLFHPGFDLQCVEEECRRWQRQHGAPLAAFFQSHRNDRNPKRKLTIGYVSPDFKDHVVGRNVLPLIENHDRNRFDVICYSDVRRPDVFTERFRRHSSAWRDIYRMSDEAIAELVRLDKVDILVDLTQHMAFNRLRVFALQPAPVQFSFAGYPGETGLDAIQYRISDRRLEPNAALADHSSGREVRMLESFWCYDPGGSAKAISPLPASTNKFITFGSLGNFGKTNGRVFRLWARVLNESADSRLVIQSPAGTHRSQTLALFESMGVQTERIEFVPFLPRELYFQLYDRIDIVLDTFPYNGHNTSLDALWMGVPVVSLVGDRPVARAGLSQLTSIGLHEFAVYTEEAFVSLAVNLGDDVSRLADLRSTLRTRMAGSVLMDAQRFARQMEEAYDDTWRRWCSE